MFVRFKQVKPGVATFRKCVAVIQDIACRETWINDFNADICKYNQILTDKSYSLRSYEPLRYLDIDWEFIHLYNSEPSLFYENSKGVFLDIIEQNGVSHIIKVKGIPYEKVEVLEGLPTKEFMGKVFTDIIDKIICMDDDCDLRIIQNT